MIRSMRKQMGIATLALLAGLGTGCSGGGDGGPTTPVLGNNAGESAARVDGQLELTLSADHKTYGLGTEPVRLEFRVKNIGNKTVMLNFPTGQQYDFDISQTGGRVWSDSTGKVYTLAFTSLSLAPGEVWTRTTRWDHRDDSGMMVAPGRYVAQASLTVEGDDIVSATISFELR